MKYISRVVEIDAEKIDDVFIDHTTPDGHTTVLTNTGRRADIVSGPPILINDYLNVTDLKDVYHMPAKIIDGPNAKYMKL